MDVLVTIMEDLSLEPTKTIVKYDPKAKRNSKVPKAFPRWAAHCIMFALYGEPIKLAAIMEQARQLQHTLFKSKNFKFFIMQGEFSNKGDPHIQGMVQYLRGGKCSTQVLYKLFAPELHTQLQCEKCRSPVDAVHYCSKPHNNCDCKHCQKARAPDVKPNWYAPIICGTAPKGRGKGRFDALRSSLQADPTQRNVMDNHFGMFIRYAGAVTQARKYFRKEKGLRELQAPRITPLPWETNMMIQMYNWDCTDRRNIIWVHSTKLNSGKTTGIEWVLYYWGMHKVFRGMPSLKHIVANYDGEDVIWFNFPKKYKITDEDTDNIESCADGGMMQAPMYGSDKNFVKAHIIVTANVPPPEMWTGPDGRIRLEVDLNPPKTDDTPACVIDQPASKVLMRKRRCPFSQKHFSYKGPNWSVASGNPFTKRPRVIY